MGNNFIYRLADPRITWCENTLQKRPLTLFAVILWTSECEISKAAEIRICGVKQVV
jgi:hypothetical protein